MKEYLSGNTWDLHLKKAYIILYSSLPHFQLLEKKINKYGENIKIL